MRVLLMAMGAIVTLGVSFIIAPAANALSADGELSNAASSNTGFTLCLGVVGSQPAGNAEVGYCKKSPTQWWTNVTPNGVYVGGYWGMQLKNAYGCLGVAGASLQGGARVVVGPCTNPNSDHSQVWRPANFSNGHMYTSEPTTTGFYELVNGHSGMCMGIVGSNVYSGAQVDQGGCQPVSAESQAWYVFDNI
jgi:hypothetical protein